MFFRSVFPIVLLSAVLGLVSCSQERRGASGGPGDSPGERHLPEESPQKKCRYAALSAEELQRLYAGVELLLVRRRSSEESAPEKSFRAVDFGVAFEDVVARRALLPQGQTLRGLEEGILFFFWKVYSRQTPAGLSSQDAERFISCLEGE